ncbi:MAG: lysine-sensitive aspartokinase 3 [Gemmatimonadetes bacterium]|nr:lysine-sensitive aspartokinase 3 [Gemmatimonadota bacterium]
MNMESEAGIRAASRVAPLVMKFGGTSVEDGAAFARLAGIVGDRRAERPVVVVSAMSRVTDGLVAAVQYASEGAVESADRGVDELIARHRTAAERLLDAREAEAVGAALEVARREIGELLRVITAHPGTRRPLYDEVVSRGERLSSLLVAAVLRASGVPACWVDAHRCIRTNAEHTRADPLMKATEAATQAELVPILTRGEVPVLGGFIGSAPDGATTTLGRGGSDYTAALVGAALRASEIQIWTDVSGFLTADPRVVPGARTLDNLSYAEAAELAYFGAKVLHPKTIQPAVEHGVPVRICNSRDPGAPTTRIEGRREPSDQGVKAIAHKTGVAVVQIASARMLGAYGFLRAIFEVFDRHQTAVDLVATSEVSVSLSLDDTARLPEIVRELETLGTVRVEEERAIVCVVGQGLRARPGIAASVFGALPDVNILLISQGASSINLTFVVEGDRLCEVVGRLHSTFFGS